MKLIRVVGCALAVLCAGPVSNGAVTGLSESQKESTVTGETSPLITQALNATGLAGTRRSPVVLDPPLQVVPFVAATRLTRVTIDDVRLIGEGDRANEHVQSIDVFLDDQGRVVQAVSPVPLKQQRPFPSPASYERQLPSVFQRYVEIPLITPKISVADAIRRSMGTDVAEQIVVYHVTMTMRFWPEARNVWVVHAWDVPAWQPIGGSPQAVPEHLRNHLRTVLDTQTGQGYLADNLPQPD